MNYPTNPLDKPDIRDHRFSVLIEVQLGMPKEIFALDTYEDADALCETMYEFYGLPMSIIDHQRGLEEIW